MLAIQLPAHLIISKAIHPQLQVLIIKRSHRHRIMQLRLRLLHIHLNPRTADLPLVDTMAHNDRLLLFRVLLLLLVEGVVVAIFPIYLGLPQVASEAGKWPQNGKLPYPALRLPSHQVR